jgi:hypothetical protein
MSKTLHAVYVAQDDDAFELLCSGVEDALEADELAQDWIWGNLIDEPDGYGAAERYDYAVVAYAAGSYPGPTPPDRG